MTQKQLPLLLLATLAAFLTALPTEARDAYYKEDPVFNPYPQPNKKSGWLIKNFGPVGIGIMLEEGMVMKINNVEPGSPAAQAGGLKEGQIIESINGVELDGRDPRLILGKLITDAEATDGRIALRIRDQGTVTVTIPVMGRYSPTWPLNCPKSDKIVRNLANLLIENDRKDEWGSVLFLLSTGEEKDLEVVRRWMQERKNAGGMNWEVGYRGIGVCEYYLRTGDESILPVIQQGADHLRDHIYNGGWAGRATGSYAYQSGGHVNASGVHCLTFLLLAKACGADVDDATLAMSLRHFYRYSGRGSVPYGDYTPKAGFSDCNGKTSGLALAMAAASRLTPEGENSIYARAAQINAMKSFYGINVYNVGHTGGGIGEIWKSASMGLMADKRPQQYRDYMNSRWWIMELSRRFDGGIGVAGGKEGNYDKASGEHNIGWGNYLALSYTIPRKHLFLFGAPSKYAKTYQLPARPWGSFEDDAFSSPYPATSGPWSESDILQETTQSHAGQPVYELLSDDKVSNRDIVTYLHHPEITHRHEAMKAVLRLKKDDMILGLLLSRDARLRHVGVMALHELLGTWRKQNADPSRVTPEMWARVEAIIRDPNESWFVKQWALGLLQHGDLERLRSFKNLLVELMEHEEHWIQGSAISTSQRLFSDPQSYREVLPPAVRAISKATAYPIVTRANIITEQMGDASPQIQEFTLAMLKPVYKSLSNEMVSETGISVVGGGGAIKRQSVGKVIGFSEEGEYFLDTMPKATSAWKVSGRDSDRFTFGGRFQSNPDFHGTWCFVDHKLFESKTAATAFLKEQLDKGKVPPMQPEKITYGLTVSDNGTVKPIGFTKSKYSFPMRYSGDMTFSTFIDKAYHYETFTLGGREFLMMEWDFEAEPDKNFKTSYKTYVKVQGRK